MLFCMSGILSIINMDFSTSWFAVTSTILSFFIIALMLIVPRRALKHVRENLRDADNQRRRQAIMKEEEGLKKYEKERESYRKNN